MFKVELEFDKTLPEETVNALCKQTDEIFLEEGVLCAKKSFGERIYIDESKEEGYGNIEAALIRSYEEIPNISTMLDKALWFHNKKCENLMDTFYCE